MECAAADDRSVEKNSTILLNFYNFRIFRSLTGTKQGIESETRTIQNP